MVEDWLHCGDITSLQPPHFSLAGLIQASMEQVGVENAPLILTTIDNSWVSHTGRISVDNITFKFLGASDQAPTISLNDLMAIMKATLEPLIEVGAVALLAAETGPLSLPAAKIIAPVIAEAIVGTVEAGIKLMINEKMEYEATNETVANLQNDESNILLLPDNGFVTGLQPGWTTVTGTLDLGDDWGKADGQVLVWVLPDIEEVIIKEENDPPEDHTGAIILRHSVPDPDVNVSAFVTVLAEETQGLFIFSK